MTMLTQLEDSLLRELASSSGNILDNASLITTLEKTRENASTIKKKIEECNQTKQVIEEARSSYKTVAQRGSTLYFASSGLTSINNMYELSLRTFIEQFAFALQNADKSDTCASRLKNLIASCTHRLYQFTCIGIFEQHRLTYALNLACMIMEESNDFDSALMNFFIKGNTFLGSTTQTKPPSLTFISNHAWELLSCIADKNRNLTDLKAQIVHEPSQFQGWIESDTPELTQPPHGKETCLSKSETLCLLRIFRPDRCYIATKLFIIDKVGKGFVESPTLNYREVYAQSTSAKPIIFILSKGADPQANIQNLGEQIGFPSPQKLSFVSLGQGQGPMAQRTLETAFIRGHWIMIQNCHLLIHWIDELESRLATLGKPHKDFRLWLTTEPSNLFPLGLLQNSYKVVIEPPDDMKLNMQSILNNFDQTVLDGCPHPLFPPLLYSLTFLHAVLQERQKYGKLGWNVPYDFNESDFTISRQLVSTYLSDAWADGNDLIPWETLKYLVGNAMYGGRVSDDMDRRILTAYFDEYFGDFLLCDGQKFHFSTLHETYTVPNVESGKLDEYICHVNYMPSTTKPAVLGLHCSADLKYFTDRMQDVWDSVAMCQVHSTGNAVDLSKDQHILSTAAEILKKVPISKPDIGTFDLNIVRKQLCDRCEDKKSLSPCAVVLLQELYHWNQLCISMFNSLQLLIKALKGETGMTDHLDETADSLNEGRLPHMWIMLAPSTTKNLQSWMSHFTRRHEQYVKWIEAGQPNVVWLSGLHFPQSFLSALLQTTCQKNGWALDETILHTEVTKVVEKNSQNTDTFDNGTYVEGLYLEGATWDVKNSKLTHQQNNDATTELPIIKIIPIQKKKVIAQKSLRTPVYLTKSRRSAKGEGLVFEAFLNTDIHHSFWILQGVAIIMNLD
jgi:dynein heavy chain